MPRATPIQSSFAAGEVSPFLMGRVDLQKYRAGAAQIQNMIVMPQGGVMRRRGSRHLIATKFTTQSRLIPFVFSRTDRFMLEFAHEWIRIFKDEVVVDEISSPYLEAELHDIRYAQSADIMFIVHGSHAPMKLQRFADDDWRLELMDLHDGPYSDANEDEDLRLTVTTITDTINLKAESNVFLAGDVGKYVEFKEDEKWRLGLIQTFVDAQNVVIGGQDVYDRVLDFPPNVFLAYTNGSTGVVTATPPAFNSYSHGAYVRMTNGGAATPDNLWILLTDDGNPTSSVYAGGVVSPILRYSYTTAITKGDRTINCWVDSNEDVFTTEHVGSTIRLEFGDRWTWGTIVEYVSARRVRVLFETPLPRDPQDITRVYNGGVTSTFRTGAWSDESGWPKVITLHEQRLVFANTDAKPQTLWFSVVDDYESFEPTQLDSTVLDTGSVTYTIASVEVNPILWMVPGQTLLIGTLAGEYQARAASTVNEPITPTNLTVKRQTTNGGLFAEALFIGSAGIYISASCRRLHEMSYSFEKDSFVSVDLTVFSEHIFRTGGGGKQVVYQDEPHGILWVRLADGTLSGCTYLRDQELVAWHRHALASGDVESMCVLPVGGGQLENLYLVVNTLTGRQIEVLDIEFDPETNHDHLILDNTPFLDDYQTAHVIGASVITGLERMEGEVVGIVIDGIDSGTATVVGGQVTLPGVVEEGDVTVGLPYVPRIKTLPLDVGSETGTGHGKIGRIEEVGLRLWNSLHFTYAPVNGDFTEHDPYDSLLVVPDYDAFFTGVTKFRPFNTYELDQVLIISSQRPYPLNILAIMPECKTNE